MKSNKMKAWLIGRDYHEGCIAVFAPTREKARQIALLTEDFSDERYIDLRCYREPRIDKYYKRGKEIMDFNDPADKLALVKDAEFYCLDYNEQTCAKCDIKKYCSIWNRKEEEE